jgi:hypothetical protein
MRFFSSGDDNTHTTQSEGALGYGGASYNTTTGNDFAQSMSWFPVVLGATGTATMTQSLNGPDLYNARTIVVAPYVAPPNLPILQAVQRAVVR